MNPPHWLVAAVLVPGLALAAAGSWSAHVHGPRIGGPARAYATAPIPPPALATGAKIQRITWRYRLPAGRQVHAELCSADRCVTLPELRGTTRAFAGLPADRPLHLQFSLRTGDARPLQVGTIGLWVNYQ